MLKNFVLAHAHVHVCVCAHVLIEFVPSIPCSVAVAVCTVLSEHH
jgi:hypothetical protein